MESGNKGQELACLRGGLECVLWSGSPGAQVRCHLSCPFPREASRPRHSSKAKEGSRILSQGTGEHSLSLSFPFQSCPRSLGDTLPEQAAVCQGSELGSWVPGQLWPWL